MLFSGNNLQKPIFEARQLGLSKLELFVYIDDNAWVGEFAKCLMSVSGDRVAMFSSVVC